jgi:hypothetical protein
MAGRWGYTLRRAPFALLLVLRAFVYVAVSFVAYVCRARPVDGFDLAFAVERSAPGRWSIRVFGVGTNFLALVRRRRSWRDRISSWGATAARRSARPSTRRGRIGAIAGGSARRTSMVC